MAEIVLGIGTSHSSQTSIAPSWWPQHVELDKQRTPYDELLKSPPPGLEDHLTEAVWEEKYARTQECIDRLHWSIVECAPDVLVIFGDDQKELFLDDLLPAFGVYTGPTVDDIPPDVEQMPPSHRAANWSKHAEERETYEVAHELGEHVAAHLMGSQFDIAVSNRQFEGRSLGHAFTFIRRRLMGSDVIPMLPLFINTYYPPNQPNADRCYRFGQAVARAIEDWDSPARVAIVGSGGLSHFIVDEELDRSVLDAMERGDGEALRSIPMDKLQSGTSEVLNWIAAAGALEGLNMKLIDYLPGYRSEAGTGCGLAFAEWSR